MPRRYAGKRKRFIILKRRRKRRRRGKNLIRTRAPLPTKFATKMRYNQSVVLSPTAASTPALHVFRANSLYDPDYTGIGHQPRGFDQLMALYDHFVVVGAKITVTFIGQNNNNSNFICGISLAADNPILGSRNDYMEYPNTSHAIVTNTAATTGKRTISKVFSNKFLGRSKPLSDSQLKGSAAGNPEELAYFHVWAAKNDGAVADPTVECEIVIDYLAVLIEPKNPSQS